MSSTGRTVVVVFVVLLSAALVAAALSAQRLAARELAARPPRGQPAEGVMVHAADARERVVPIVVSVSGFLAPYREIKLSAEIVGSVESQYVDVSDAVEADEPLFQIDYSLRSTATDQARAAAERARSELKLAEENAQRVQSLRAADSANEQELLRVETELAVAKAAVRQANGALDEAMTMFDKTLVRAPFAGVIADVYTREGEYALVAQPLADLIEVDRLKLVVELDDREVVAFSPGDPVELLVPALPGEAFEGTIRVIHPRASLDSRKFKVEIEVPNADGRLRPGFYVDARLSRGRSEGNGAAGAAGALAALTVPRLAVLEQYKQQYCFVIRTEQDDDGASVARAFRTPVETTPLLGDQRLVKVVYGLSPGDVVVTTGLQHVTHESVVRIVED